MRVLGAALLSAGVRRVVLVNPRAQRSHRRIPLSVLFLARGLPDGLRWDLFDANVDADAMHAAARCIAEDPEHTLVLVTVMPGPQLRRAVPWSRLVKATWPGTTVVWGGYFPSVYAEAVVRDRGVDLVVVGQGEQVLPALLQRLGQAEDPAGLPGVVAWRDGAIVRGPGVRMQRSASFGLPDWSRLDMNRYAAPTFLGRRTFNHHSSVGCPYVCNFCAVTSVAKGRWIADKAGEVIAAVRALHGRYGADAIEFHDNNFFAAERRVADISKGIRGLGLSWWGEGRIDTMLGWADATWKVMAESGLRMVFFGAESGDPDALEAMDKGGLQIEQTIALNTRAARFGVIPEFSFVLGNPADPDRDIAASIGLIRRLKADNPCCEIILYLYTPVPLPGMFDDASAQGFAFPTTLDEWLSPRWDRYEDRRNPGTPWLTPALVRRVYDFEAVLHARFPSASDRRLSGWQRRVLRFLSGPRYRLRCTVMPHEIRALQRLWSYRRPEEMGF